MQEVKEGIKENPIPEKEREEKTSKPDFVKWFSELNKDSGKYAGGKGANLAEIYNLKIPVPPGFVVTAQAYDYLIEKAGLQKKISEILSKIDYENTKQLDESTKQIRELIEGAEFPKEMQEEIIESYGHLDVEEDDFKKSETVVDILKTSREPLFVAVRSSATAEDLADASFAGQQDSFVNVKGNEDLIEHIKKCFASLYTSRATYYRNKKNFKHEDVSLAVIIQKMVDSVKSGVVFSKDPTHKNDNVVIEAVWGLGEGIVSGAITPDKYVISPKLETIDIKLANKKIAITRDAGGKKVTVKLREEKSKQQVLKEYEIKKLAEVAIKLEKHYQKPQDIEFAIEGENIMIVQTRPITTIETRAEGGVELKGEAILTGLAASPGIGVGRVKIVKDLVDLHKVNQGDVLVTGMTNPDMVVTMQKSAAIVTDEGGLTAHAAIVSREMGIPCFSGETKILTNKGFLDLSEVHREIKKGKDLLTLSFDIKNLKSEWKKIKNASKRKAKTIKISMSKNGKIKDNILRTTPEHKFFSIQNRESSYHEIQEVLKKNKTVYLTLNVPKLKSEIKEFDNSKAYISGAIFSDGYTRIKKDGSASVVFVQKNIPSKKDFIKKVKEDFKKTHNYELKQVNKDYFYCYKKAITKDFIDTYENLLKIILNCKKEQILNYLAGMIDGDGNFIKRGKVIKISLNAKKPQILMSLVLSCMRLNIKYRIKKENNQYRFYICSSLELIEPYLKRLKIVSTTKTTGDNYLSAKDLFSDISVSGRKGIKSFVKSNRLISKETIRQKVLPYIKDKKIKERLQKIIDSPLEALRVNSLNKPRKEYVYNIEVDENNNYVVFSDYYSPIIVKNCVVGTQEATTKLKEGEIITVDGTSGKVYKGKVAEAKQKEVLPVTAQTKTEIKIIVDLPSFAERASKSGLKKVGLTRIEGIIAESGKHPQYFLEQNKIQDYEEVIFKGIQRIAKYFEELWIRTSDIRSDEFQNLEGAPQEKEANPMLGMHGIRYGLKNPDILKAELKALKRIADQGKTIGLLLPQIISVDEIKKVKEFLKEIDFQKAKVGVMVETPAAVQIINDLCAEGIDFISFGTNDLTQYILAVDRGNEQVQYIYNELNPAILYQLEFVIRVCKRNKVQTSICGQSGSKKEMVKFLVEKGIDSISVNADVAKDIADYIAELEKTLIKDTDKEPRQYQPEEKKEISPKEEFVKPQNTKEEENSSEEKPLKIPGIQNLPKEEVEENIQAIEKEKQEYLKEHPEEADETNASEDVKRGDNNEGLVEGSQEFDHEPEFKDEKEINKKDEEEVLDIF